MKTHLTLWLLGLVPVLTGNLVGQSTPKEPLELQPASATINRSSFQASPPANIGTNPVGSDSRPLASGAPTPRQSQSVMSFGGGVGMGGPSSNPPNLKTNRSLVDNAVSLNLPRLGGDSPTHVLLRARIGSPMANPAAGGAIKAVGGTDRGTGSRDVAKAGQGN